MASCKNMASLLEVLGDDDYATLEFVPSGGEGMGRKLTQHLKTPATTVEDGQHMKGGKAPCICCTM